MKLLVSKVPIEFWDDYVLSRGEEYLNDLKWSLL